MKKEIGGYFELEDFGGKEYYPNLYKVNLGRTALRWLLEGRGYTKIYQPLSVGCGVKCFASPEKTGRK